MSELVQHQLPSYEEVRSIYIESTLDRVYSIANRFELEDMQALSETTVPASLLPILNEGITTIAQELNGQGFMATTGAHDAIPAKLRESRGKKQELARVEEDLFSGAHRIIGRKYTRQLIEATQRPDFASVLPYAKKPPFSNEIIADESQYLIQTFLNDYEKIKSGAVPGDAWSRYFNRLAGIVAHYGTERTDLVNPYARFRSTPISAHGLKLTMLAIEDIRAKDSYDRVRSEGIRELMRLGYNSKLTYDERNTRDLVQKLAESARQSVTVAASHVGEAAKTVYDNRDKYARAGLMGMLGGSIVISSLANGGSAQAVETKIVPAASVPLESAMLIPAEQVELSVKKVRQQHEEASVLTSEMVAGTESTMVQQMQKREVQHEVVTSDQIAIDPQAVNYRQILQKNIEQAVERNRPGHEGTRSLTDQGDVRGAIEKIVEETKQVDPTVDTVSLMNPKTYKTVYQAMTDYSERFKEAKGLTEDQRKDFNVTLAYLGASVQVPSTLDALSDEAKNDLALAIDSNGTELVQFYSHEVEATLKAPENGAMEGYTVPQRRVVAVLLANAEITVMSPEERQAIADRIPKPKPATEVKLEPTPVAEEAPFENTPAPEVLNQDEITMQAIQRMIDAGPEWRNRGLVLKRFVEEGYSVVQGAGSIGNFVIEAGNDVTLPPEIRQFGGGPGIGIVQWEGLRKQQLMEFAASQGTTWDNLDVQLDFIFWELNNTEKRAKSALLEADSVRPATDVVLNKFERPRDRILEPRLKHAEDTYAMFNAHVKAINDEIAAAEAAAQAEAERIAQEEVQRKAQEETERITAEEAAKANQMPNGLELLHEVKHRYTGHNRWTGEDNVPVSGVLEPTDLEKVGIGNHRFHPVAAEKFKEMNKAFKADFGYDLPITDSYRPFDEQITISKNKGKWAATPGKSNHGWGFAADISTLGYGTPHYNWLYENGPKFGWYNPEWAQQGGRLPEPWHWEFTGSAGQN